MLQKARYTGVTIELFMNISQQLRHIYTISLFTVFNLIKIYVLVLAMVPIIKTVVFIKCTNTITFTKISAIEHVPFGTLGMNLIAPIKSNSVGLDMMRSLCPMHFPSCHIRID